VNRSAVRLWLFLLAAAPASLTGAATAQESPHHSLHYRIEVAGDLTVHGRTVKVQLPVAAYVFPDRVEVAGSFPLNWKEFGIADPSFVARVKEPMQIVFRLRAVPENQGQTTVSSMKR
jgi:YceI-like domain